MVNGNPSCGWLSATVFPVISFVFESVFRVDYPATFIQFEIINAPVQKKFVKLTEKPEVVLMEHIIMGDKGDGVPNILSDDDTFVTGSRQRPMKKDKVAEWKHQKPEDFITSDEMWRNFQRNRELVDLSRIPEDIKAAIIDSYEKQKGGDRSGLLNYFIANRMKQMIELIDEF